MAEPTPSPLPATGINAEQIEYWNRDAGHRWAAFQQRIDALFAPLTAAAIDHAAPESGAKVLDIGCGCGTTLLELARRVGPQGHVLGVDISKVMLDVATARIAAEGLRQAEVLLADASTHPFPPGAFDLVFSRFGVMFFDDPVAAFANIRRALRPGGRLAFVCWRRMSENPWSLVPFVAAKPHVPPQEPPAPDAPGPFAFADEDRVRQVLAGAGFADIALARHDPVMPLGGPGELDRAAEFATRIGPVSRWLAAAEPEARARAEAAIHTALAAHDGPEGVVLSGSVWLVSARA